MREIRFRGKTDCGKWVYGYFTLNDDDKACIIPEADPSGFWREVDPATVGQYTGLKDKSGKEIYEGDIVRDIDTSKVFEIMYQGHMFLRYERKPMYMFYTLDGDCLEVIGNIHDNPDLLEEEYQC